MNAATRNITPQTFEPTILRQHLLKSAEIMMEAAEVLALLNSADTEDIRHSTRISLTEDQSTNLFRQAREIEKFFGIES